MVEIPLTRGVVAWVDDVDAHLADLKWQALRTPRAWYAVRHIGRGSILMHRLIVGEQHVRVDHITHRPMSEKVVDNRRANLRPCTQSLNLANQRKQRKACSSRFKGVSWSKTAERWHAYITKDGVRRQLGFYRDETQAALAYNAAARELYGDFALLNEVPQ